MAPQFCLESIVLIGSPKSIHIVQHLPILQLLLFKTPIAQYRQKNWIIRKFMFSVRSREYSSTQFNLWSVEVILRRVHSKKYPGHKHHKKNLFDDRPCDAKRVIKVRAELVENSDLYNTSLIRPWMEESQTPPQRQKWSRIVARIHAEFVPIVSGGLVICAPLPSLNIKEISLETTEILTFQID